MAVVRKLEPGISATLIPYVERTIEGLWLFMAALVPLIFVPTDFMLSEAVNAYVEVPKTTALRTLAGIMTILWIFEWVLKDGLTRRYTLAGYSTRIKNWVAEQPASWIVVAATFYVVVAIVSTFLSTSFWISMWGEVSGQFGYSAYTTVSYFMLFVIIATHLKTPAQLWRLLIVLVGTGALIALYGTIQHYGGDPLDLGEGGSARISSTMANPVFAGAALVTTTLLTIGVGLAVLEKLGWIPLRVVLWVALIGIQMLAVYWTGSRGSFLLGVPAGLLALLFLSPLASGLVSFAKAAAMVLIGLLITFAVVGLTPSPSDAPGGWGQWGRADRGTTLFHKGCGRPGRRQLSPRHMVRHVVYRNGSVWTGRLTGPGTEETMVRIRGPLALVLEAACGIWAGDVQVYLSAGKPSGWPTEPRSQLFPSPLGRARGAGADKLPGSSHRLFLGGVGPALA